MCISDFLNIPYLSGGRDKKGTDCWGLVLIYYKEIYGTDLPDAKYSKNQEATLIAENMHKGFIRIENPQIGDFILIDTTGSGTPCHIGVVINSSQFLHSLEPHGSHISHIRRWGRKIYGFYRKAENNS